MVEFYEQLGFEADPQGIRLSGWNFLFSQNACSLKFSLSNIVLLLICWDAIFFGSPLFIKAA